MLRKTIFILFITAMFLSDTRFAQAQEAPHPQPASTDVPVQPTASISAASKQREQELEERVQQLEKKVDLLSAELERQSVDQLVQDAQSEARSTQEEVKPEEREFLEGGRSLQELNPELTFTADILAGLIVDDSRFYAAEHDRSGIWIRGVGLHFQHALDPFSMFKSAFHFAPEHGVEVEEVYISWSGLIPSVLLSAGRFRENFGILNRWHGHELDQTAFPLAMRLVLGDEGLVGNGIMVKWLMPNLWAHANELTLEVVDGDNETLFSGEHFSVPSAMLHLKNYYDLSDSTYLELGLTGMYGYNNRRGVLTDDELVDEPWRRTVAGGADLTLYWAPTQHAKYESFTWRTEAYYANKQQPTDSDEKDHHSWSVYSYLQYQIAERWYLGARVDLVLPTRRVTDAKAWDIVFYITFWQSEFVYLRLEYQHGERIPYFVFEDTLARRTDNRVLFQIDFAAGPHKHEKY